MLKQDKFKNINPIKFLSQSIITEKICTQSKLNQLIKLFGEGDQETIELSGLSKLVGHPDIQTIRGVLKLRKRTMDANIVTKDKVQELLNSLKKRFCQQYLRRHKRWPELKLTVLSPYRIVYSIISGLMMLQSHPILIQLH